MPSLPAGLSDIRKRALADGHTLLIGSTPLTSGSLRNQKPYFDTLKNFTPITIVVETSNILAVNKSVTALERRS